jgi:hypothetical protein
MAALAIHPDPHYATKLRFAMSFLRLNDAGRAAMEVVEDASVALIAAQNWPFDPIVIEEMSRLVETNGPQSFLPTREIILIDIKKKADETKDADSWVRVMELYCKVRNFIEKPGTGAKVDVTVQSVLVVPSQGSDDNWERAASLSQRTLIDGAADRAS